MQARPKAPADLLAALRPAGAPEPGRRAVLIGLIGRGIGPSRSPIMHEREGARFGLDYAYRLVDFDQLGLDDGTLHAVIAAAEELGFSGLNVTHPFKQGIVACLTELSPDAAAIGAVNTVVFKDGGRIGHNTDSWGFAESFRESMAGCGLDHVLQLGAGGAGAAVAHALLDLGAAQLVLFDTSGTRAEQLADRLNARFGNRVEVVADIETAFARAGGVVNTTPVGMAKYPGLPFAPGLLSPRHWVAEIIYFPAETALLRLARERGCRTLSGLGMAVNQAVRAFELFTGIKPDKAAMTRHFAEGGP
ncbi:MAG TPA: shikimate dehydrogenase [Dongiaceae bacterium]|nr:shikimate dehydrogenase [Dongiaceae bacterium]